MSDHVDGPRQIGDPAADLSDVFAFTSPENAGRTVLAANVFPSAGVSAMFSNAINHSLVVRRVTVAALGDAARFKTGVQEYRFNCRFSVLEHGSGGANPIQRGTCTFPDGQKLDFVVNDEKGASTPDGVFRVFAGLRSDPFFLAWFPAVLKKAPNLLLHDNVLSIVIEFDTRRWLDSDKGSLFGVIAETSPVPGPAGPIGHEPPRFDWIGRPEQTNMRLNNPAMAGTDDLRDLWNQQTPFAIAEEYQPVFRQRLIDSLTNWDMRDGHADWTPATLAASANVYLNDFLLFDVSKPMNDTSFLEIEKSTLHGHAYQTGGGRTVNANVIDIMITWMVNNDREFLQGGATGATKPGGNSFPYLASPNSQLQTVVESVDLPAQPDQVWALIGPFDGTWHPLIARIRVTGTGVGQLRTIETIDGKFIIERLEAIDDSQRFYRYAGISGIQTSDYTGTLDVKPKGTGSSVQWRVQYLADGQPDFYREDHHINVTENWPRQPASTLWYPEMIEDTCLEMDFPLATAGDIAVNNLESARQQSWSRFWQEPERPGIAEYIVEQEQLATQFLGDMRALDRLETLVNELARVDGESVRTALIHAQVAAMTHRFAEAKVHLGKAGVRGVFPDAANRLSLSIDQACGTRLQAVLEARRRTAAGPGRLEDLIPLGALLADLCEFDEADRIYQRALSEYQQVSPFAVAWVCFQLGVLWGELVAETQSSRAAQWYRKAIEYLPCYVKARVHLAEIYVDDGRTGDAEAVLLPALASGDPEVYWRLADVMVATERFADAEGQMQAARSGFELLLGKHLLAFADHGAEFYLGSGNNAMKAFELARINVANRPTLRAFEQAYATAVNVGESNLASEILAKADRRWGATAAFQLSPLASVALMTSKLMPDRSTVLQLTSHDPPNHGEVTS